MWLLRTRASRALPTFDRVTRFPYVWTACLLAVAAVGAPTLLRSLPSGRAVDAAATAKAMASEGLVAPRRAPEEGDGKSSGRAIDRVSNVTVARRGELLEVRAHQAPLREVLDRVTRATGVAFSGGDADEPVTAEVGPLAVKESIAALLAHTSYGYLYVEAVASTSGLVPARVILIGNGKGGVAAGPAPKFGMAAARSAESTPVDAAADPEALRQQRTAESLLEVCKSQGCDSS